MYADGSTKEGRWFEDHSHGTAKFTDVDRRVYRRVYEHGALISSILLREKETREEEKQQEKRKETTTERVVQVRVKVESQSSNSDKENKEKKRKLENIKATDNVRMHQPRKVNPPEKVQKVDERKKDNDKNNKNCIWNLTKKTREVISSGKKTEKDRGKEKDRHVNMLKDKRERTPVKADVMKKQKIDDQQVKDNVAAASKKLEFMERKMQELEQRLAGMEHLVPLQKVSLQEDRNNHK